MVQNKKILNENKIKCSNINCHNLKKKFLQNKCFIFREIVLISLVEKRLKFVVCFPLPEPLLLQHCAASAHGLVNIIYL